MSGATNIDHRTIHLLNFLFRSRLIWIGTVSLVNAAEGGRTTYCYIQDSSKTEMKVNFYNKQKDYAKELKVKTIKSIYRKKLNLTLLF